MGGKGHDTYIADLEDTIRDVREEGKMLGGVQLGGVKLTGGERDPEKDPENIYYGNGKTYYWLDGKLTIVNGKQAEVKEGLVIENFKNGDLGIDLGTKKEDEKPDDKTAANKTSPIVIDLNRDGITTSKEGNHIYFGG